jgi:hypothetical protein
MEGEPPVDKRDVKRTELRECKAIDISSCQLTPAIESHARSLNEAHAWIRAHGAQLAELKTISAHLVERMTRGEGSISEQHRLLITLQGGVAAVRAEQNSTARAIDSISRISQGTHDALISHVEHSRVRDEEASAARIKDHEGATFRGVRFLGVASGIFLLLAAFHGLVTGTPLWTVLMGMLKGG